MFLVVRQYGRPLVKLRTTATKTITARDLDRAIAAAQASTEVTTGYYDVVLTADPSDPRYDRDSAIQIK